MEFKDQLNRTIHLPKTPSRIVSLVPSQTELLVDLGLRNKIVGITKFCVHPKKLIKEIAVVGGTKEVHLDKIKKLRPDFILCNKEENTLEMVRCLEVIAPVWISDIVTIEESIAMIDTLGTILDVKTNASKIISEITNEVALFNNFMKDKPSKKVLYLIWKKPYMAAGKNTFINVLLKMNNFENIVIDANSRYPEVNEEEIKSADLILLSTEPYPFKNEDVKSFETMFAKKVKLVDGEFFSWYGSRLIKAFSYFKTLN